MIWLVAISTVLTASSDVLKKNRQFLHPAIADHGRVVRLPDAAEQPRDGSKICIDLTAGGPPETLNPAIEKLARYVNIYAGAGKAPAKVRMIVVLHGNATMTALHDSSYARRFKTRRNPNLALIHKLRGVGVTFFVCGQTMAAKGAGESEVARDIRVAVSALTVNVNRQQRGYAYIPLH